MRLRCSTVPLPRSSDPPSALNVSRCRDRRAERRFHECRSSTPHRAARRPAPRDSGATGIHAVRREPARGAEPRDAHRYGRRPSRRTTPTPSIRRRQPTAADVLVACCASSCRSRRRARPIRTSRPRRRDRSTRTTVASAGKRVHVTHPPNPSFNGMPSSSTRPRLDPDADKPAHRDAMRRRIRRARRRPPEQRQAGDHAQRLVHRHAGQLARVSFDDSTVVPVVGRAPPIASRTPVTTIDSRIGEG